MVGYVIKRLLVFLATIWIAITINFLVVRLTPVDPIAGLLGRMASRGLSIEGGDQIVAFYRETFALDKPLFIQYLIYLKNLLSGHLGYSLSYFPQTVESVLLRAIPWSVGLLFSGVAIAFVLGNLLGALAVWPGAPRLYKGLYKGLTYGFMILAAVPFYVLALILLYVLAFMWPILPTGGAFPVGATRDFSLTTIFYFISHATLPVLSIALGLIGFWALSMRGVMISVLGQDYLNYARIKGLSARTTFLHYGLRNAMLPQVTLLAIDMGKLISGQVLVEAIFNYPGVGTVLFNALRTADYFVIQGTVLFIIISVSATMLMVDLIYPLIDPRIRRGKVER